MAVRIGINSITWRNDDVFEFGGDTHPLTYATKGCRSLLAAAKEAGFAVGTRTG